MKKFFASLCLVAVVVGASAATAAHARTAPEPHPRIRASIAALNAAAAELKAAPHDFNGHRADALKAIDAALVQLNLCMAVK
jgi:hypothetical protein